MIGLLAINPFFCNSAAEMHNYAFCVGLIQIAFLLFVLMVKNRGEFPAVHQAPYWFAYSLVVALSMWMHLLSGLVAFLLGVLWVVAVCCTGFRNRSFVLLGAGAQVLILLLVSPWLIVLNNQLEYLGSMKHSWMTPTTVDFLGYCFYVSVLFAQKSWDILYMLDQIALMVVISLLALLLPWCGGIAILQRKAWELFAGLSQEEGGEPFRDFHFIIFLFAFFLWGGFIFLTWSLTVFEFTQIFHISRYQAIVHGPAMVFLGLCLFELNRFNRTLHVVATVLLFQGFVLSHMTTWIFPNFGGRLVNFALEIKDQYPPPGSVIAVYPDELISALPNAGGIYRIITFNEFLEQPIRKNQTAYFFDLRMWALPFEEHDYFRAYLKLLVHEKRAERANKDPDSTMGY